jgi:hypothetical protein
MPTLAEQILELIGKHPGRADRELAEMLRGQGANQQPINQAARSLERQGRLWRRRRPDGLIGNYRTSNLPGEPPAHAHQPPSTSNIAKHNDDLEALSEDEIKKVLVGWLDAEGWTTQVAWGRTPGIDIDARRGKTRRIIEVKGPGSRPQMRANYFLGILGETLQRMDDPDAEYFVALPDLPQFRGLWNRLPELAKQRMHIAAIFVSVDRKIDVVSS